MQCKNRITEVRTFSGVPVHYDVLDHHNALSQRMYALRLNMCAWEIFSLVVVGNAIYQIFYEESV